MNFNLFQVLIVIIVCLGAVLAGFGSTDSKPGAPTASKPETFKRSVRSAKENNGCKS